MLTTSAIQPSLQSSQQIKWRTEIFIYFAVFLSPLLLLSSSGGLVTAVASLAGTLASGLSSGGFIDGYEGVVEV